MEINRSEAGAGWLNTAAAIAAAAIVALIVLDISTSMMAGEAAAPGTMAATDLFALLLNHPYRAFQYLGLINVFEQLLMVPVFLAFYASHRSMYRQAAMLAVVLFGLGLAVYVANNAAMPLWHLSGKYAAAGDLERPLIAAAGEGMLARGEDFVPGSLPGFVLNEAAVFVMLGVMLRSGLLGKVSPVVGLIGASLLTMYQVSVTFSPGLYNTLMPFAMFGGTLMLVWYVMIALRFRRAAR